MSRQRLRWSGDRVRPSGAAAARERSRRPVVMLVDDDPLVRDAVRAALAGAFEVIALSDAIELEERLEAWRPEALILDLSLPVGPDGREACRSLRAGSRWRSLPVLIASARDEWEALEIGVNAGADAWLSKPLEPGALERELERLIGLKRGREED